jgi:predicted dinucleotide-binding enzyme
MKIAVLGAKIIGSTLGKKWVQAGHTVVFGVRHVENAEVQALVKSLGSRAALDTVGNAIRLSDVVVLAIPGGAMEETIAAQAHALDGKIIIDAANRMGGGPMKSAAAFAAHTPSARVFRAFNSLGWENFENPRFGDLQADLFYCGPEGEARTAVERLIADVGLRPICVGGIDQVQVVDSVTSLWFALARHQSMGRHLAFKVLT